MSIDRSDFGPRVAMPMVPRVTSGHQRSLETMIAVEVVRALAEGPVTQFSAVVNGIQIACRDNGIVLTEEPAARDINASSDSSVLIGRCLPVSDGIAEAEAYRRARKAYVQASRQHLHTLRDQRNGEGESA